MTEIPQDALTPPGTLKVRYLLPSGTAVEFFIHGNTVPEQVDNLIQNGIMLDEAALEAGLISANQTAGGKAIASAGIEKLKQQFKVREGNELFHCVSIDVEPAREGKSKVAFFGDNFKQPRNDWPTTSLLLEPEQLQEALDPYYTFQLATFDKFGTFAVDFYVETYQSTNLNQYGNPYTNVSRGGIYVLDDATPPAIAEKPEPPEKEEKPDTPPEPEDIPF
jgi:hypothetical protein